MLKTHTFKLTAYPKELTLRDQTKVTVKPMTESDGKALLDFFRRIPADERYYLKDDVTSPEVIERWSAGLDYNRTLPLLAWVNGRIVADATLHRTRANARRHVGQLRVTVDAAFRDKGLGTVLLRELVAIANENVLDRVLIEVVADREEAARKAAEAIGFVQVGLLPGHAKDLDGHPRDIVLLEMPLGKWLEWWEPQF
jgi:L-amino acid N-acyltransferase YncA